MNNLKNDCSCTQDRCKCTNGKEKGKAYTNDYATKSAANTNNRENFESSSYQNRGNDRSSFQSDNAKHVNGSRNANGKFASHSSEEELGDTTSRRDEHSRQKSASSKKGELSDAGMHKKAGYSAHAENTRGTHPHTSKKKM